MRDLPVQLPPSSCKGVAQLFGFQLDGSRRQLTLADMLEPGALKAELYRHSAQPGQFCLLIGTDGWTMARYVSDTPLGRMVLELAQSPAPADGGKFERSRRSAA